LELGLELELELARVQLQARMVHQGWVQRPVHWLLLPLRMVLEKPMAQSEIGLVQKRATPSAALSMNPKSLRT
jgi:hypothetical protein